MNRMFPSSRTSVRFGAAAALCSMLLIGGAAQAHRTPDAAHTQNMRLPAAMELAQNSNNQRQQPNSGNRRGQNPPNGNSGRGRPQTPDRLCADHPNPRPGQNCTENPDHFRPAQRPPD